MKGQIFINYRRDDSSASAGRIYDRLNSHFASNHILMDVDNLDPGVDFVDAIEESVGSCDVLIAVIGKHWLISSDEEGRRRLDNPEDFVPSKLRLHSNVALESSRSWWTAHRMAKFWTDMKSTCGVSQMGNYAQ
ncbi:MAG: toll/interleukin-1 receptor domain-containing protein [Terrimicrobiaceae bacterium]